jgi:hypothetical protein
MGKNPRIRRCRCSCLYHLPYRVKQKPSTPPSKHPQQNHMEHHSPTRIDQHVMEAARPPRQKALMPLIKASDNERAGHGKARSLKTKAPHRTPPEGRQARVPRPVEKHAQRAVPAEMPQLPQKKVRRLKRRTIRLPPQSMAEIEQPPARICGAHRNRRFHPDNAESAEHGKPCHRQRQSLGIRHRVPQITHRQSQRNLRFKPETTSIST